MIIYSGTTFLWTYYFLSFSNRFFSDIDMPSSQFKFNLSNITVGVLDEPSSRVIGRSIGYTQVTLVDNSIPDRQMLNNK